MIWMYQNESGRVLHNGREIFVLFLERLEDIRKSLYFVLSLSGYILIPIGIFPFELVSQLLHSYIRKLLALDLMASGSQILSIPQMRNSQQEVEVEAGQRKSQGQRLMKSACGRHGYLSKILPKMTPLFYIMKIQRNMLRLKMLRRLDRRRGTC